MLVCLNSLIYSNDHQPSIRVRLLFNSDNCHISNQLDNRLLISELIKNSHLFVYCIDILSLLTEMFYNVHVLCLLYCIFKLHDVLWFIKKNICTVYVVKCNHVQSQTLICNILMQSHYHNITAHQVRLYRDWDRSRAGALAFYLPLLNLITQTKVEMLFMSPFS